MRDIVQWPDERLRQVSSPVVEFDERLAEEIATMRALCVRAGGVGLAAVQIGDLRRVIVLDDPDLPDSMVNPRIACASGSRVSGPEGCLSIAKGAVILEIERPETVDVTWQGVRGERRRRRFQGYPARVLCHEIDHLDGILISDRAGVEQRVLSARR